MKPMTPDEIRDYLNPAPPEHAVAHAPHVLKTLPVSLLTPPPAGPKDKAA